MKLLALFTLLLHLGAVCAGAGEAESPRPVPILPPEHILVEPGEGEDWPQLGRAAQTEKAARSYRASGKAPVM